MQVQRLHILAWWCLFLLLLAPLLVLVWRIAHQQLGPEPAEYLVHYLGQWALYGLLVTLAVTPVNMAVRRLRLVRYRRMLGLWCLFYAVLHALAYPIFMADWANIVDDLTERPYIIVGALALCVLLLLGITSPRSMVRKLGARWKVLHRSIYLALALVLLHVWWQVRSDYSEALLYTVLALILMLFRRDWLMRTLFSRRARS